RGEQLVFPTVHGVVSQGGAGGVAPAVPLVYDTFTDADSTALTSHAPDIDAVGGGWTVVPTTVIPHIQGNRAASTGVCGAVIDAGQSEYKITAKATVGGGGSQYAAIYCRYIDGGNRFHVEIEAAANALRIYETTSGGSSVIRAQTSVG